MKKLKFVLNYGSKKSKLTATYSVLEPKKSIFRYFNENFAGMLQPNGHAHWKDNHQSHFAILGFER